MAITKITTESGSVYLIDDANKTWRRSRGEEAAFLRSDDGVFNSRSKIELGVSLELICPPYNGEDWRGPRVITSTPIVKVEEIGVQYLKERDDPS